RRSRREPFWRRSVRGGRCKEAGRVCRRYRSRRFLAPWLGIASSNRMLSGMARKVFDYDNDGTLDLLLCNGHPELNVAKMVPGVTYAEPMMLYRNTGRGFENISKRCGPIFSKLIAGRGLAIGDFDNDGSVDVLVSVNDSPP